MNACSIPKACVEPFQEAVLHIFAVVCHWKLLPGAQEQMSKPRPPHAVTAVMPLVNAPLAFLAISLPESTACAASAAMLHDEPASTYDLYVGDGIGELLNLIAGNARAALVDTPWHFRLDLPKVSYPSDAELPSHDRETSVKLRFSLDEQELVLIIGFHPGAIV